MRPATDSLRADTTVLVAVRTRRPLPTAEQRHLAAWLRLRAGGRQPVRLLIEPQKEPTLRPAPARRKSSRHR